MEHTDAKYCYRHPHPAITADCVVFGFDGNGLRVLLVERGQGPYIGSWALPGGFMHIDETVEEAARRELLEETGLQDVHMEQFRVFSSVGRDPRERVVTVVFIALVRTADYHLTAGDDAADTRWFDVGFLPPMAFDHAGIIGRAHGHLTEMLRIKPIVFRLLDRHFTLAELQRAYEAVTGRSYDRRNFRRKALRTGMLVRADKDCLKVACADAAAYHRPKGRPGKLFRLKEPSIVSWSEGQSDVSGDCDDSPAKALFNF